MDQWIVNWRKTWLNIEKLSETAALEKMDLKYDSVLGMRFYVRSKTNN